MNDGELEMNDDHVLSGKTSIFRKSLL